MSQTYDFWINQLFGSVWSGVIAYAVVLLFIGVVGKMGNYMMISLLALYIITMSVLFGGMVAWLLVMIISAIYFVIKIVRFFE